MSYSFLSREKRNLRCGSHNMIFYTCQLFLSQMHESFALLWPGCLKTSQQLVTWQLGVTKITQICGSKDGGNGRNNGFLASILLPSTPIMLACLHEFSSPPALGNACHPGYNLKIDRIFSNPSWPKSRMGKRHILAFGGLHPQFRGKDRFAGCSSLFCLWLRSWTK